MPAWFLGSIPFIRKHGGAALAHQAMSKVYGPVWVSHGGVQPFVITVRTKHVDPTAERDSKVLECDVLVGQPRQASMPTAALPAPTQPWLCMQPMCWLRMP